MIAEIHTAGSPTSLIVHAVHAEKQTFHASVLQIECDATVKPSWSYDPKAKAFAPPPGPTATDLVDYVKRQRVVILGTPVAFNVAAAGEAALTVMSDGSDATMNDLGALWRFGVVNPKGSQTWVKDGVSTILTGLECIALETKVSAWRSALRAFVKTAIDEVKSGKLATTEAIDALPWPKGA